MESFGPKKQTKVGHKKRGRRRENPAKAKRKSSLPRIYCEKKGDGGKQSQKKKRTGSKPDPSGKKTAGMSPAPRTKKRKRTL